MMYAVGKENAVIAFSYTDVPAETMPGATGVAVRWVLSNNVQAPHFSMRVIEVQPGAATERHTHAWEHGVFVLEGAGLVRHQAGESGIGPGTCVYVAPNELHQFANAGASVLRVICVIPNPD